MVLSNGSWAINEKNVLETLHRAGGRLESRLLVGHFLAGAKSEDNCKRESLNNLCRVASTVAKRTYTSDNILMWELKREFS